MQSMQHHPRISPRPICCTIDAHEFLHEPIGNPPHSGTSPKDKVKAFEKSEIKKALDLSRNLMEVSDHLGISRQTLQYKMRKYDLK